jgi:hypothetical protein
MDFLAAAAPLPASGRDHGQAHHKRHKRSKERIKRLSGTGIDAIGAYVGPFNSSSIGGHANEES